MHWSYEVIDRSENARAKPYDKYQYIVLLTVKSLASDTFETFKKAVDKLPKFFTRIFVLEDQSCTKESLKIIDSVKNDFKEHAISSSTSEAAIQKAILDGLGSTLIRDIKTLENVFRIILG